MQNATCSTCYVTLGDHEHVQCDDCAAVGRTIPARYGVSEETQAMSFDEARWQEGYDACASAMRQELDAANALVMQQEATIAGLRHELSRIRAAARNLAGMNDLTDEIRLEPTEAGYRVLIGESIHIGHLLLRIYQAGMRVKSGCLATPSAIDEPAQQYKTIGAALDYLLSIYLRRAAREAQEASHGA